MYIHSDTWVINWHHMIKICEDLRVKIVSRHEVNAVTMPVKISNT